MTKRPLVSGDKITKSDGRQGSIVNVRDNFALAKMDDTQLIEKVRRVLINGRTRDIYNIMKLNNGDKHVTLEQTKIR